MNDRFIATFKSARRAGAPLIAVETPDPAATISQLLQRGISEKVPVIAWDVCRGWRPLNPPGEVAMAAALRDAEGNAVDPQATLNAVQHLVEYAPNLAPKTVLFLINAHLGFRDGGAGYLQAVWNLRDQFKKNLRSLVLLGPAFTLPPELANDTVVMDEPLPSTAELEQTVKATASSMDLEPSAEQLERAVSALRGLAAFPAEQAVAMSLRDEEGGAELDMDELWERKRRMIGSTPGLQVYRAGTTLEDVGGCDQVKKLLDMHFKSKRPPQAVLFIDEGEKMFAGATAGTGDSSGVSQGILGAMLTWQQEANSRGSQGMLCVGPPGAAKTMVATSCGSTYGVPTISMDTGAMKASLVGETERQIRGALKVVDAVAERVLVIMTCNKDVDLPPELKRRYKAGTFFFDLPDVAEQEVIWQKKLAKYGLPLDSVRPLYQGWTGAEIDTACELAWNLSVPLADTWQFIVPVAKSAAEQIEQLRRRADGRYLSASKPGFYQKALATTTAAAAEGDPAPRRRTARRADQEV